MKSILDTFEGGITEGFEFFMGENTEVVRSCSAILNGELFVFGGSSKKRQVSLNSTPVISIFFLKLSKVVGCGLKRIGDLSYEFYRGACGTFSFPQERIMLCFSISYKKKCER